MRATLIFPGIAVVVFATTIGHAQTARNQAGQLHTFQHDAEVTARLWDLSSGKEKRHVIQLNAEKCGDEQAILRSRSQSSDNGGTAVIRGRIATSWGAPIAAAQVLVSGTEVGHITASDGTYRIEVSPANLPKSGNLTLQAGVLGFTPKSLQLSLSPNDSVVVDFVLCPAPLKLTHVASNSHAVEEITTR